MATLLLIVIYIAFIGLGIPDSLFGTAWPAIYTEMDLPVSWASFVTVIVSGGTIVSSLLSARVINRFGTAAVTAVSTAMTALALFGFSVSGSMLWLCLFAVPLGLGAGSVDTALNNYVALHYKAVHMNFLHCFYGIGVSLSPYLMSLALSGHSWRSGYRTVFWIQLGITAVTVLSLPLWKKAAAARAADAPESPARTVGFGTLLKNRQVRLACLVFIGSCGLEYTCGTWGSTFWWRHALCRPTVRRFWSRFIMWAWHLAALPAASFRPSCRRGASLPWGRRSRWRLCCLCFCRCRQLCRPSDCFWSASATALCSRTCCT